MRKIVISLCICFCAFASQAQVFTAADSLRGSLNANRNCYDVTHYALDIRFFPDQDSIAGSCRISYRVTNSATKHMQLDLFNEMKVLKVVIKGKEQCFERKHKYFLVELPDNLRWGDTASATVYYSGKPQIANDAPWDGGFVYKREPEQPLRMAVACEGVGASLWWPCKDHLSDKPDSAMMSFTVPDTLQAISNGRLRRKHYDASKNTTTWTWAVTYPINTYNITFYIGQYTHISDSYLRKDGTVLTLDYYVFPENEKKARSYLPKKVKKIIEAFEFYFGPYPFQNDGYKLVETTYWGMEHQSAIAYGNHYQEAYGGTDFIILHETAHEWWGNCVTVSDHADMWVHEAFATYAEYLYLKYHQIPVIPYLLHWSKMVQDGAPIQGPRGVNFNKWPDADMYYKGALALVFASCASGNEARFIGMFDTLMKRPKTETIISYQMLAYMDSLLGDKEMTFLQEMLYRTERTDVQVKYTTKASGQTKIIIKTKKEAYTYCPVMFYRGDDEFQVMYLGKGKSTFVFNMSGWKVISPFIRIITEK